MEHSKSLSDEQFHLLYSSVTFFDWSSPLSAGPQSNAYAGQVFSVVVIDQPPLVNVNDADASESGMASDPGNRMQRRTPENGKLEGFMIDFLGYIALQLGCQFKYYYPCKIADWEATGSCARNTTTNAAEALKMLGGSTEYYGPTLPTCADAACKPLCDNNRFCFAAGLKISEQSMREWHMSQPILLRGFTMVVAAGQTEPDIMSWAAPFELTLWMFAMLEVLLAAACLAYVEGWGQVSSLPNVKEDKIGMAAEAIYWSAMLVLGAASKQPLTHAGRTLVLTQLFFTLLVLSVYTGNLNAFLLNVPFSADIDRFDDLFSQASSKFSKNHVVCLSEIETEIKQYLDLQTSLTAGATVKTITAPSLMDCMIKVYAGDATTTFYDEPVVLSLISEEFYKNGLCGDQGGMCSDAKILGRDACLCSDRDPETNACLNPDERKFTSRTGSLISVGETFNPFGYGLTFPPAEQDLDVLAFNQVILFLKEEGIVDVLASEFLPDVSELECPTGFDAEEAVSLGIIHVAGLFIMTGVIAFIAVVLSTLEMLVRIVISCCTCCSVLKERIDMEMLRRKEFNGEISEPSLSSHGKFVVGVFGTLEHTQGTMKAIEDLLAKAAKGEDDED